MGFQTQTKLCLNNAHICNCYTDVLGLTGSTYFGKRAEYLTGMTPSYNYKTITDVDFVTGQTANLQADIDYISGITSGNTADIQANLILFTGYTATTQPVIDAALTGATNGLHADPITRRVGLGGDLTGDTTISTCGNEFNVYGANGCVNVGANGVNISGTTIELRYDGSCKLTMDSGGTAIEGQLVLYNNSCYENSGVESSFTALSLVDAEWVTGYTQSQVSGITACAITDAENGLHKTSGQKVALGGSLTGDTAILLNGKNICIKDTGSTVGLCIMYNQDAYLGSNYNYVKASDCPGSEVARMHSETSAFTTTISVNPKCATIDAQESTNGCSSCIKVQWSATTVCSDYSGFTGVQYDCDYSCNYVNRSIPDVEYVNNCVCAATSGITACAITGACNGLSYANQVVVLGGTLTGDTSIDMDGNLFEIYNTPNSTLQLNVDCAQLIGGVASVILNASGVEITNGAGNCLIFADNGSSTFSSTGCTSICYDGDYENNFVARSLVTKQYVCSQTSGITGCAITGATNGLTKTNQRAELGGTLCKDTTVLMPNFDMVFSGNSAACYSTIIKNGTDITTVCQTSTCLDLLANGACDSELRLNATTGLAYLYGECRVCIGGASCIDLCGGTARIVLYNTNCIAMTQPVYLTTTPNAGDITDKLIVRDATGEIQQLAVSAVTCGLQNTKQDCIAGASGLTNQLTFICNSQECGTTYMCYDNDGPTLVFGVSHNITGGSNACCSAIIGGCDNTLDSLRAVMLGGCGMTATGSTYNNFAIVECLAILNDIGCANKILCVNSTTGIVGVTSFSASGAITGGTNGIVDCGNCKLGLGGALCSSTTIDGAGFDLSLGSAGSKLNQFNVCASGATTIDTTGSLSLTSSGATYTDISAVPRGIQYGGDYSLTFCDNSLVTKCYVDTIATGLNPHAAVCVATTANIVLNSGTTSLDGVTLVNGMRVLVKDQSTPSENGIYIVNSGGTWTRATDYNFSPAGEVANGDLIPVLTGSTLLHTVWILTTKNPIVSGDSLTFTEFSQLLGVTAGNGITITTVGESEQISVKAATGCGIIVGAGGVCIDNNIDGSGLTYSSGVLSVNACSSGTAPAVPVGINAGNCLVVETADISAALGGVLTGSSNGLHDSGGIVSLGGNLTGNTDINGTSSFDLSLTCLINFNLGFSCGVVTDTSLATPSGLEYAGDYSPYYGPRSLVDAGYVTGLTSGLQADIDYISGCTSKNANDIAWISGVTDANLALFTGYTASTQVVIDNALTGSCNGLHDDGRVVGLGGALTGDTLINACTYAFCIDTTDKSSFRIADAGIEITSDGFTNATFNNKAIGLVASGTTASTSISIQVSGGNFKVYDEGVNSLGHGIQYNDDYSSTYAQHTLVDCQFVENQICCATSGITACALTGACNGLSYANQVVVLGGALTEDTYIYTCGSNDFVVSGANACLCVAQQEITLRADTTYLCGIDTGFILSDPTYGAVFIDSRTGTTAVGLEYYSNTYRNNFVCNSLVDAAYVTGLTSGLQADVDYISGCTSKNANDIAWISGVTDANLALFTGYTATTQPVIDAALTGATNGLHVTGSGRDVSLGGQLTGDTTVDLNGKNLLMYGSSVGICMYDDGTNTVSIGANSGLDYISVNGASDTITISTSTAGITLVGGTNCVDITGILKLETTPTTGSTSTDVVLVWNNIDKQVKCIPASSLGQDNNRYAIDIFTGNTTLPMSGYTILVNSTGATVTLNLPAAPVNGQAYKIKDAAGTALTYNITITGGTIDGSACALINTDYGALDLAYSSALSAWFSLGFIN
jgi:hypothetical protein